jgi:uncharacterized membrane protein YeiH
VLLDRRPLFWVEHALCLWAMLAMCIAAMLFMPGRHLEPTERAMHGPDVVGRGGWVLVAAQALMLPAWMALLAAALVATGLRVAAVALDWRLPAWRATRSP